LTFWKSGGLKYWWEEGEKGPVTAVTERSGNMKQDNPESLESG
jgi:hypothetical protein